MIGGGVCTGGTRVRGGIGVGGLVCGGAGVRIGLLGLVVTL